VCLALPTVEIAFSHSPRPFESSALGRVLKSIASEPMRPTLLMLTMLLSGCASVSSIPLSKDTFQVVANASSYCSADNAQKAAFQEAAVETIR
jgi:hypothetical protein